MGAVVTAVLFTVGKFADRLLHRQEWRRIGYGAAASIITLLLWIYYSSLILLFGAEFTKAYAEKAGQSDRGRSGVRSIRLPDALRRGLPRRKIAANPSLKPHDLP